MKAFLMKTGSVPIQNLPLPDSFKVCMSHQDSIFAGSDKFTSSSQRISLHFNSSGRRNLPERGIGRSLSESDVIRPVNEVPGINRKLQGARSRSLPAIVPEEMCLSEIELEDAEESARIFNRNFCANTGKDAGVLSRSGIPNQDLVFPGGGIGQDGDQGVSVVTRGNGGDRSKIGAYYKEMLKSNPTDSLLLRNYGNFLHEVEKDTVRAAEYYGRAILANPGDGELLSLYGKLIWETEKDEDRAKSYFDQAVSASPDDCTVLGSYAHFMWETEEDEDNDKAEVSMSLLDPVAAF
ncbi:Tetratricopeptide repeat (TPR)-like superfamily protein [Quillaja saponaria]|uniref:Tetratricopeptide repeat (TPR)-like superfamily protein n=1 Tax=Quillaja saponaria TaxID=32244 RepID=A0AAD7P6D9_QUISA|nr:Tetratricopeptide repeat (TPR)-like superfamily protein [Quillaja saponaria]